MRIVSEIMTPVVKAIHKDEPIREAERIFITENIQSNETLFCESFWSPGLYCDEIHNTLSKGQLICSKRKNLSYNR